MIIFMTNAMGIGWPLIQDTIKKSEDSPRGRAVSVLHPAEKPGIRLMVNAIQPESYIRPHMHESADEVWNVLTGRLRAVLFDERGKVTSSYDMESVDNNRAMYIPPGVFHTLISLEPNSSILETTIGPYNPDEYKNFASFAPEEPEGGVTAYGHDIQKFMEGLREL